MYRTGGKQGINYPENNCANYDKEGRLAARKRLNQSHIISVLLCEGIFLAGVFWPLRKSLHTSYKRISICLLALTCTAAFVAASAETSAAVDVSCGCVTVSLPTPSAAFPDTFPVSFLSCSVLSFLSALFAAFVSYLSVLFAPPCSTSAASSIV